MTELAWILATVTGMGLLERAHAYNDKLAHGLPASVVIARSTMARVRDAIGL